MRRIGRLKDRVTIESPPTDDGYGHPSGSWSTVATRNCSIEPMNGKEYWGKAGESQNEKVVIRFRHEAGILERNYRLTNNRVSPAESYDIQSIINVGNENREMVCVCELRK